MEESVDVKALRAKFNSRNSTSESSSRDSGSPNSPRPLPGRVIMSVSENNLVQHRLSPAFQVPGQDMSRFPRAEPMTPSASFRTAASPRLPPSPAVRGLVQSPDSSKVKQAGEMLQSKMVMMHQRHPGNRPMPTPAPVPAAPSTPSPLRNHPRQRSAGDVIPLRRPLPPDGPQPLKPKRPPFVNLEPFMKFSRAPALPGPRKRDVGSPVPDGRKMSLPSINSAPQLPHRSSKPSKLIRQVTSMDIDDNQETYDDIGSFEKNESWSDNSSQCMDDDNEDVYESIDEDQVDANRISAEKRKKKEEKMKKEQQKKEEMEKRKKENELKKNFQLQGEVEVLHIAKVRHDWNGGGKLDLRVQQGDSVEIIRVKNNPGGKWLARSLTGNYGYISNTCVDIDYEEVKRKVLQSRKIDTSPLPPPPPDPPQMFHSDFNSRESIPEDEDDYDDVQQLTEDFPPPPPEISIDPKMEKELKKKFKYEGPLKVLHTMMVNPNGVIKKPSGKDLKVTQGEVVDVIELTDSKKALCRNQFGKYGYVPRSLLLQMEGDIYDDVDYPQDIYDNDSAHTDY